jgi:hypothetical protein
VYGGSGELRFNSPFRNHFKNPNKADSKHHLYVNYAKGLFHCHKSGISGSISYLFYLLGAAQDSAPIQVPTLESIKDRIGLIDQVESFVIPTAPLPDFYGPVRYGSPAYVYLRDRGVTDDDIAHYRLGEGYDEFPDCVIIPSFGPKGECEYWVMRRTYRVPGESPYKNPTVSRRYHVGFLHQAVEAGNGTIVLVEGAFDALATGRDAVCTYGKHVSDDQLTRMQKAGVKKIIVALDPDARKVAMALLGRAMSRSIEVEMANVPVGYDPGDIGRHGMRLVIQEAVPIRSDLDVLRLRIGSLT